MIKTRIKHKRDTAANWTAENPILLNGEIAIVDDGNSTKLKIGDGSTAYNSLPFYVSEADLNNATGVISIANGGTGATTAANARTNLGLSTAFTAASISGKVITLTFADGTTKTLTTQDTTGYHTSNATSIGGASATKPAVVVTSYRSGNSWYRVYSDKWVEQGGVVSGTSITFHKAFANTNYTVLGASTKASGSGAANSLSNMTTTSCTLTNYNNAGVRWYACGVGA